MSARFWSRVAAGYRRVRRMGGGVEGCGGASIAIHLIWPSIIDTSGTVHDHRRIYRLHLHYWSHMNFSLLFFSSSTLRVQNSNVCGGKRGGVTSWKSSNPHFSYRANAGSSAQHSWQSVFSTGKPLMLFIVHLSLQQRRTRRGRQEFALIFNVFALMFFFLFHTKKLCGALTEASQQTQSRWRSAGTWLQRKY